MELTVTVQDPIAMVYGSLREKYAYVDGKKTQEVSGYSLPVVPIGKFGEMCHQVVNIKLTDKIPELPIGKAVRLKGLTVKPYVDQRSQRLAYSFSVAGIKAIGKMELHPESEKSNGGNKA
ncbi:hypothetical protein ATX62_05505 [Oenococcus oeni]|uniref:hypothetical protein n=1 Tax=Oenococcus oeni TaxID=1247 RepID=UPI0008F8ABF7|nr:hypothetical protein [Oenococcus oeni]OIM24723.1 hypothetical protein ATX62_05505 [Oenococcus oeni]